ncbi:multidrug efflux MFS transporter, partial [Acinetobacter baumannii]|uniref:multidrug efflux MFS transporter n=1 Tax=Acinetobacter baumannii TaxID=470 RepID=UPI000A5AE08E
GTHATAVNNTARQVASSIAVALLTSVTQNIINNHMPADSLKESNPLKYAHLSQQASIDGFNTAFIIVILFAIIGIILVAFLKMNIIESDDK